MWTTHLHVLNTTGIIKKLNRITVIDIFADRRTFQHLNEYLKSICTNRCRAFDRVGNHGNVVENTCASASLFCGMVGRWCCYEYLQMPPTTQQSMATCVRIQVKRTPYEDINMPHDTFGVSTYYSRIIIQEVHTSMMEIYREYCRMFQKTIKL